MSVTRSSPRAARYRAIMNALRSVLSSPREMRRRFNFGDSGAWRSDSFTR